MFILFNRILICCVGLCIFLSGLAVGARASQYLSKSDSWYQNEQAKQIASNILSWQDDYGSWPKNTDTVSKPYPGKRKDLHGTFDNRATTSEMRFLARMYVATDETQYKQAFLKAFDLIIKSQYPTGGWPQYYPLSKAYHRHITFNDGAMVRLMELLKEIANREEYDFVDAERRAAAQKAFDRGVECILKCQIRVNGKLTVWCAQHDEIDYSPRPARSYELASLSGGESVGILRLLMKLDDPSPEVVNAINAGVQWYKDAKVQGIRLVWKDGERIAISDPNASPLWGRFCEIQTNRPIFCDRDGIPKYDYNQIGAERRGGYTWYSNWGQDVFDEYEKWKKRHTADMTLPR